MCLYPRIGTNNKYKANKRNGGNVPEMADPRFGYIAIECKKCIECRKKAARDWRIRLQEEIKNKDERTYFVTLTFSNESWNEIADLINGLEGYNLDNEIAKKGIQRFTDRWKKKYKKRPKRWMVTELGEKGTERIHIHGILWTNEKPSEIKKIWRYGHVYIGEYVNGKTISYIVKYLHKQNETHKTYIPRVYTSPGIGKEYKNTVAFEQNRYRGKETKDFYRMEDGSKVQLPNYFRMMRYTEEERELLWAQKLDMQTRYVLGEKFDVSKGFGEFEKKLYIAQRKNDSWGYGNNVIDWDRRVYERKIRRIRHDTIRNSRNNNNNE